LRNTSPGPTLEPIFITDEGNYPQPHELKSVHGEAAGVTSDFALDETNVEVNGRVAWLRDELTMTFVMDYLVWFHFVRLDCVGASSAEGVM